MASTRWRPLPSGCRAHPAAEAVPSRATPQVVELVEVGVLAEGQPHAAGELGHLVALGLSSRGSRAAAALAASRPWW